MSRQGWKVGTSNPPLSEADTPSPTHTYKVPGSEIAPRSRGSENRTGEVGTFQPSNPAIRKQHAINARLLEEVTTP